MDNKKKTIIKWIYTIIAFVIIASIIPCFMGNTSYESIWCNSDILEWSNGYFWRGFMIGVISEVLLVLTVYSAVKALSMWDII